MQSIDCIIGTDAPQSICTWCDDQETRRLSWPIWNLRVAWYNCNSIMWSCVDEVKCKRVSLNRPFLAIQGYFITVWLNACWVGDGKRRPWPCFAFFGQSVVIGSGKCLILLESLSHSFNTIRNPYSNTKKGWKWYESKWAKRIEMKITNQPMIRRIIRIPEVYSQLRLTILWVEIIEVGCDFVELY